jgi:SulP family sulfate permease
MTGFRHRSNMELVAQGIANIVSPLFQGIPATGAIARTATNIKNGGRSPVAGIVHAVTLLLILLFFGKWAALIPMATLAGILITVAYNMSEWKFFLKILRGPQGDVVVLLVTFLLTVLVSLTVAIEMGVVLAAFLFMHRVVDMSQIESVKEDLESEISNETESEFRRSLPDNIEIFEINGPFFFGATEKFKDTLREIRRPPKALILLMAKVPNIDTTGVKAMEDILARCEQEKIKLILVGLTSRVHKSLTKAGFFERFKTKYLFDNIQSAIDHVKTM